MTASVASLAGVTGAGAQSFGINFRNGTGGFAVNPASGLTYSGVPASQWHNSAGTPSATNEAVAAPGATGVTVSYSSANTWGTNMPNDIGDGYLDDTAPGLSVTLSGLSSFLPPGKTYRVRALQSSDNATAFTAVTIYQGTTATGTVLATLANPVTGSGGPLFGESAYSVGLTNDVITLKSAPRATTVRGTLAGLVIEVVPPPADHFFNEQDTTYETAPLGNGLTSTFRIGSAGADTVSVSSSGGLSVGTAPGHTHLIEIVSNDRIVPGTYTLIDYEGTIGGAGFAGFSLGTPHLDAELVDNVAETKIDLVITEVDALLWTGSPNATWDNAVTSNWSLYSDSSTSAVFKPGDEVIFDDTAAPGEITISGEVKPALVTFVNDSLEYVFSGGSIGGATALDLYGHTSVTFGSANTFTGKLTVSGGTLVAAAEGSLGATGGLELTDATLKATTDQTVVRPLNVAGGGSTIEVASGMTLDHQGKLDFDSTLTKTGEGTLTFTGYSGSAATSAADLVIDGGSVEFRSSSFNGAPLGGEAFQATVNTGGILRFTGLDSIGGDYWDYASSLGQITVAGGTFEINGRQYLGKNLNPETSRLVLDGGVVTGSAAIASVGYNDPANHDGRYSTISVLANANASEIRNAGGIDTGYRSLVLAVEDGAAVADLLFDAPVTGANGFIKTGLGTLTYTGSATNTGTNEVREGSFVLAGTGSLGTKSTLDLAATASLRLDYTGTKTLAVFEIGGVPQATGTWGRIGSGAEHPSALITGDGLLLVSGADPFADWISTNYPALTGADAEAGADPDGDGLSNLVEFAFDGNPASGVDSGKSRSRLETVGTEQALVLTIPVRDDADFGGSPSLTATIDGVTWTVAASNDLATFDQDVSELTASAEGLPELSDGWSYRSFRLEGAIPARGSRGFLRVTVE
ncbi:hypothetical protein [Luteolibacter sp. Populi]|uniref:hypothetical protein n=1 Tax=Luteolibacter sp. Populi TaxID=3230487 RepID=UPI0034671AB2